MGDEQLMQMAQSHRASIFQCDEHQVYHSRKSQFITQGSWSSWVNTGSFVKVWEDVRRDGLWRSHDWTVKVDPDTVFLPDRLRAHIRVLRPPADLPIYLQNSDFSDLRFLGAIETVSRNGLKLYFDSYNDCHASLGDHSGEDGFMKGCFDSIGVGFMNDNDILATPFDQTDCTDGNRVAFHPRKKAADWLACWNNAR